MTCPHCKDKREVILYRENGTRRLFVSMARDGRCIKAEGLDTAMLWDELAHKACNDKPRPVR